MYTTVVVGGILLIVALIGVAMWCCYRAGWDNGYDQANGDQRQQVADEQQTERKTTGRHAAPREPWPTWADAKAEYERRQEARTATTAADIAPVVLPEPGTYKPQPGRDSGPGTVTLDKVYEELSATGPILALTAETDAWIADRAVEEEQFRLALGT